MVFSVFPPNYSSAEAVYVRDYHSVGMIEAIGMLLVAGTKPALLLGSFPIKPQPLSRLQSSQFRFIELLKNWAVSSYAVAINVYQEVFLSLLYVWKPGRGKVTSGHIKRTW